MNTKFAYCADTAVIWDEKGKIRTIKYTDNTKEILTHENIIELTENEKESVLITLKEQEEIQAIKHLPMTLLVAILACLGSPAISYLLGNKDIFTQIVNTKYGQMNDAMYHSLFFTSHFLPCGIGYDIYKKIKLKLNNKNINGLNCELNYLENLIEQEKNILEKLKSDTRITKEPKTLEAIDIYNKDAMKEIENKFDLYFDLGYDTNYYYKNYQKGRLEAVLKRLNYKDEDIQAVKEFIIRYENNLKQQGNIRKRK